MKVIDFDAKREERLQTGPHAGRRCVCEQGNYLEDPLMPPARKREPIVPAKVKAAVDYMFASPAPRSKARPPMSGW
jgi:hypothetical protein